MTKVVMRDIAGKCGVAVGTMYNYFPSKEYLTGCVVLEDWLAVYEDMTGAAAGAATIGQGIQRIYDAMCSFVEGHQYLLAYNSRDSKTPYDFRERHMLLLSQIVELIHMLRKRFGCAMEDSVAVFVAECILSFSRKGYTYSQIAPAILKLLN